jgi:ribose transport system permease protein
VTPTETPVEPASIAPDRDAQSTARGVAALRGRLAMSSTLYLAIALLALVVVFGIARPNAFLASYNVRTLFTDASTLLVLAVGATFVIATAGIDLSVGAVLVISGVLSNKAMVAVGGGGAEVVLLGLLVALAVGLAFGIFNGLLITKAAIPPLIATLGTLGIAFGVAQVLTGGNDLAGVPQGLVDTLGTGRLLGIVPWLVVIAVAVTAAGVVALRSTRFGRYTLFIGSNAEAARRAGVSVDRHLVKVYALAGVLAGLGGFLSLARFATTTIAGHSTDNLQAITAVVLGGTSLFGGVASVIGTTIGVFIPAVLQNGFVILDIQPFWQQAAMGAVLLIAVYFDQLKRRARAHA